MRTVFRKQLRVVLFVSAIVLCFATPHRAAEPTTASTSREKIGEVFGKPVYRDEIRADWQSRLGDELHRLFRQPVTRRYCMARRAEIAPTQAEIDTVKALVEKNGYDWTDLPEPRESDLRLQLKEVEAQLTVEKISERRREHLEYKQRSIERKLDDLPTRGKQETPTKRDLLDDFIEKTCLAILKQVTDEQLVNGSLTKEEREQLEGWKKTFEIVGDPDRMDAVILLSRWNFERDLYDKYGGGRILRGETGYEAFDATRRWLEAEEQKGNFKITDPKLREAFYSYWTQPLHSYLVDDVAMIRKKFLEPEWAPRRAK